MLDRLDSAFARQRLFVSDASHELRSPLTAIRGQLEVLGRNETPSAAEVRHVERMTMVEMGRAERLVDDLLSLARLDEGGVGPVASGRCRSGPTSAASPTGRPTGVEVGAIPEGTIEHRPRPDRPGHPQPARQRAASRGARRTGRDLGEGRRRVPDRLGRRRRPRRSARRSASGSSTASIAARPRATARTGGSGLGLGIARSIVELHGGANLARRLAARWSEGVVQLPGFRPA